eukprot:g57237.t1
MSDVFPSLACSFLKYCASCFWDRSCGSGVVAWLCMHRKSAELLCASTLDLFAHPQLRLVMSTSTTSSASPARGLFVLFEGLDRTGKSTQVKMLTEYLQTKGEKAVTMRFPDRETEIGKMINAYLTCKAETDDHAIHLLFAANRWEKSASMVALLEKGTSLVVDRYSYSGVAFSAAKGLDSRWCFSPEVGLPSPDLVLFLQMPLAEAAKRGGYGEERYEAKEIQQKVADQFEVLRQPEWKVVDASGTPEEVHARIRPLVLSALQQACKEPVRYIRQPEKERRGQAEIGG